MSGNLGSLVLELQGNVAKTQEDMGRLNAIVENACRRMDAAADRTSQRISNVGRGGIGRIEGAEEATRSIEKVGHASTGARREMLVLAHEISQGNFKRAMGSLMVLGERMDIMGKLMSPMGLAIGGVTIALGGAIAMMAKGAIESSNFAKSLLLTSNYAGLTEQRYNDMSRSIANTTGATIGNAREITQGLVSSGRVGADAIESVSRAAVKLQEVTGQKSEEVVKDFAKMSDGVLKWALEADKQYHFVNGALYDHIKALEEAGKKEEAMRLVSDALFDHLGGKGVQNLGYLAQAFRTLKNVISDTADALMSVGRAETAAETALRIKQTLDAMSKGQTNFDYALGAGEGAAGLQAGGDRATLLRQQSAATSLARRQADNADLAAFKAHTDEMVVAAKTRWDELTKAHKVGAERLQMELDEAARVGKESGASSAEIQQMQDRIRKQYQHGAGGGNVNRAEAEALLKPLQDQIAAEDKLLAYRERMIDKYYKDDRVSIASYYDDKRVFIEANNKRVAALYDQEIAIYENAAKHAKNRAEAINDTTKAEALRDAKSQALLTGQEKLDELTQDQARDTEKYRDEVTKLTAELDKLNHVYSNSAGAEFDRTHAGLRKQATAADDTGTIDTLDRARAAAVAQAEMNTLKSQAKDVTDALTLAVKRYNLEVSTGQKSEFEGDYLISQARIKAAGDLEAIAGKMQNVADATNLPALINEAQQFKLEQDEVAASANVMAKNVGQFMGNGLTTILENTMNHTKSLKQSILDFANTIEQTMTRLIAQDLFNRLFNIGGSGGSGGGGWIAQLIGMAMGAMGGGGDVGGPATFTGADAWGLGMPGRASGGPTVAGGMYEVNERGPELLTIANRTFLMMGDESGKVTPMSGSNTGGGQNVFHMNIAVPPGTTRATAQQQAREIMTHAQIAMARNA